MRKIPCAILCLVMICIAPPTSAQYNRSELAALIAIALENNPTIRSHAAQSAAAHARIPQASALDDPRLGLDAMNIPLSNLGFGATPMSGKDISVKQKIPFPGKLRIRKKAARAAASAADALLTETENRIRFQVKQTYFHLYRLDKEITIVRTNMVLLGNLAKVAEARFATGAASAPDVFRAETFKSTLENTLLALTQERESVRVRMNTLLNRSANIPLRLHYHFSLSRLPPHPVNDPSLKNRPLIQALHDRIDEATQHVRLAKRDFLPDFDFGISYRQRDSITGDPVLGSDFISGGVMMNVPLWAYWRQNRKLQERRAEQLAAQFQYEAITNETEFEALDAYRQLHRQHEQIDLYHRALLPQTRATFESSYTAYQAEDVDFFSTIEALKDQFETELRFYALRADYEISLAKLEWVLGQDLSHMPSEEHP